MQNPFTVPELKIAMLGHTGVGKTTILATMYNELQKLPDSNITLSLEDLDQSSILSEAYSVLEEHEQKYRPFEAIKGAIQGTEGTKEYLFNIKVNDSDFTQLKFMDHRGGDVTDSSKQLSDHLNDADVIINTIDAAVMMETDGPKLEKFIRINLINDLLRKLANVDKKRLIIFVLTKGEKWLHQSNGVDELTRVFENKLIALKNTINSSERLVGVCIPVETIGCVEFARIDTIDNKEEFVFQKIAGHTFNPVDIDKPLRLSLAFAIHQAMNGAGFMAAFWNQIIGKNKDLENAIKNFAGFDHSKFKKYGNTALLKLD